MSKKIINKLKKLENGEPGYECSRCDGIHLPRDVAEEYVSKISGYL
jgi:hypothetical protein